MRNRNRTSPAAAAATTALLLIALLTTGCSALGLGQPDPLTCSTARALLELTCSVGGVSAMRALEKNDCGSVLLPDLDESWRVVSIDGIAYREVRRGVRVEPLAGDAFTTPFTLEQVGQAISRARCSGD